MRDFKPLFSKSKHSAQTSEPPMTQPGTALATSESLPRMISETPEMTSSAEKVNRMMLASKKQGASSVQKSQIKSMMTKSSMMGFSVYKKNGARSPGRPMKIEKSLFSSVGRGASNGATGPLQRRSLEMIDSNSLGRDDGEVTVKSSVVGMSEAARRKA